jgi:hypothetical protein
VIVALRRRRHALAPNHVNLFFTIKNLIVWLYVAHWTMSCERQIALADRLVRTKSLGGK